MITGKAHILRQERYFFELDVPTNSADEKFLLYGDKTRTGKAEQIKALWEKEPTNPAYFAEYAVHHLNEHKSLPADFLTIAADIDPDNAWFTCLAANFLAKDTLGKPEIHPRSPVTKAYISSLPPREQRAASADALYWQAITDTTKAEKAIALWRKSLTQNKYESYQLSLHQMRYPYLDKPTTFREQVIQLAYLYENPSHSNDREILKLLRASLQQQDDNGEDCTEMVHHIEHHLAKKLSNPHVDLLAGYILIREVDGLSITVSHAQHIDAALRSKWAQRHQIAVDYRKQTEKLKIKQVNIDATSMLSSDLRSSSLTVPYGPKLTAEQFAAGLYVDHVVMLHALCWLTMVMLFVLLPVHFLFMRRKLMHQIATPVWHTIPWRVSIKTFVWCVVLPCILYVMLYCFTPILGKEYGRPEYMSAQSTIPLIPFIGLLLIILALPRLCIHRFIADWQQLHRPEPRWHGYLGWICLMPVLWLILRSEHFVHDYDIEDKMKIAYLPICLWMLWNWGRSAYTQNPFNAMMHIVRRRVLAVTTFATIILFAMIVCPALKLCERYWIANDPLFDGLPYHKVAPTKYEADVIEAMNIHLNRFDFLNHLAPPPSLKLRRTRSSRLLYRLDNYIDTSAHAAKVFT